MALKVNLRQLDDNELHVKGEVTAAEMDLDPRDQVIHTTKPLTYDLQVQMIEESLLVEGELSMPLSCDCVRCLKPFEHVVCLEDWAIHIPLNGDEAAPVVNDLVDLTPFLREDILLNFPQHPLCGTECGGLPESLVNKTKQASAPNENGAESPAWGELDKLKL